MPKPLDKLKTLISRLIDKHYFVEDLEQQVEELITLEADFTLQWKSHTLVHSLVSGYFFEDNARVLAKLLTVNPALASLKNEAGFTPLQVLMTKLVAPCDYDKSPYFSNFKKMAMALANAGSSLSVKDCDLNFGYTLMHHLTLSNLESCNEVEIQQLVTLDKLCVDYTNKNNESPLQTLMNQCVVQQHFLSVVLLFKCGANFDVHDNSYLANSILHHLVLLTDKNEYTDEIFAHCKAQFSLKNAHGQTPLHYLIHKKSDLKLSEIESLINYGSDLFTEDKLGRSFLYSAVSSGNHTVARYLEKNGLNSFELTKEDRTLFHAAVKTGNTALWNWLFNLGLNINAQDKYGHSVLHLAVDEKNLSMIKWLIAKDADLKLKNLRGETPIDCAYQDKELKSVLQKQGRVQSTLNYYSSFFYTDTRESSEEVRANSKLSNTE